MIPDSLDFILRPTNDEQAEYAARPHRSPCLSVQCATCYPGVADGYNASRKALDDFQLEPSAESLAKVQAEMDKLPAASSPAAGRISEEAVRKGSQAASSGPRWSAVDDDTSDLLTLVANQQSALPEPERQWEHFLSVMRQVARRDMWGLFIDQNDARELLRGEVSPNRIGAFYHRAARMGLIRRAGWNESNDRASNNAGKPQNTWEWLGT